ncbi:GNAT family N-acetyltransferase [Paenibacillus koleovorans]|uniref:GNAT family N-acetyltransferase n=1 Tax=Paenibacillus koleovorans TaxID=121608 RepID=UPI000FD81646|nr:GNAT family protein [Paenibacillus koleovorans]
MSQPPNFHWIIAPLTEQHAEQITTWKYEPPYDVYQWPAWERMLADDYEFANAHIRETQYIAILDTADDHSLAAYAQLFPLEGWTRLGIGLHPVRCGLRQGVGLSIIKAVLQHTQQKTPANRIDLEVFVWNVRAIRAYSSTGFEIQDTYERKNAITGLPQEVHCMELNRP